LAHRLGGAVANGYPAGQTHWQAALAPFLGGNLLSDYQFTGVLTAPVAPLSLAALAGWTSRMVYPLGWAGIALVAWRVYVWRMEHLSSAIERVVLASLILQAMLFGVMRIPAEPQYFFGAFVVQALLPWLALEAVRPRTLGSLLLAVYGGAVCFVTIHGMISIHRHGYAGAPATIKLADQVEVARALNRYSDESPLTDVAMYREYPQALRALRLLLPPTPRMAQADGHRLLIRAAPGPSGRIEVVEQEGEAAPLNASMVDVTPLPEGWQPTE
jgi:hypothetical protein